MRNKLNKDYDVKLAAGAERLLTCLSNILNSPKIFAESFERQNLVRDLIYDIADPCFTFSDWEQKYHDKT